MVCFLSAFCQAQGGLKINIVSTYNGYGLTQDIDLLTEELKKLGHEVEYVYLYDFNPRPKVDINLYIQSAHFAQFPYAEKNYFIPNPEGCFHSPEEIARFDKILCRTKEVERIFKPLNPNTEFISFTGKDYLNSSVAKDPYRCIHLAGGSIQKGTEPLAKTWVKNPQFPHLLLIRSKGNKVYPAVPNLTLIYDYLPAEVLTNHCNAAGIHLCPSETEGFGHYIFEAFSCGSVVVTIDAPPMNEFVTDKRCLIDVKSSKPWEYATSYFFDPKSLERVMTHLLTLSPEALSEIGKRNREFYLENDRFFKKRLGEVFSLSE